MVMGLAQVAGQPRAALTDVSGKQIVHEGSAVAVVIQPFVFQPNAFQTGGDGPPNNSIKPSGAPPDGDPRNIDEWPDFDSVKDFDQGPDQAVETPPAITPEIVAGLESLVAAMGVHLASDRQPETLNESITETVGVDARADARLIPGPQRLHSRMTRSIDALRSEMERLGVTRIGHNNPPSTIDEPPVFTAEQVAQLLSATDTLRRTPPTPHSVPDEAREAQKALKRIFAEAFAQEMGTQGAQAVGWGLKAGCAAAIIASRPFWRTPWQTWTRGLRLSTAPPRLRDFRSNHVSPPALRCGRAVSFV